MPTRAPIDPNWLEQRGTKFGTGSPMSRPTFWDQLRSDGYPQIWSGGPKNGCRTIFQLSLAKIGGTPHSQLVQKGQLGRLITCSNIVPRCTICFEPLGALAVILGHFWALEVPKSQILSALIRTGLRPPKLRRCITWLKPFVKTS